MNRLDAIEQYNHALKLGQKYYKDALAKGISPYPAVLDDILDEKNIVSRAELGVINIPSELIAGTRSSGRTTALAGNFMPLLDYETEFGSKWVNLCSAHLSDEGIRDPIRCYEYLGKFYIEEGNKRASVLMSYGAPLIPAYVTRLVPEYSEEHSIQLYYAFMQFYALSGQYGVNFVHTGDYARLQAKLGMEAEHIWDEREKSSFSAGFSHFRRAFDAVNTAGIDVTPAQALLQWLEVFSFAEIKSLPQNQIAKKLTALWPDICALEDTARKKVVTEPSEKEKGLLSKIFTAVSPDHINAAFIYAYPVETSSWTYAHDKGREYLEKTLGKKINIKIYQAYSRDYFEQMEKAVEDGAQVIFATTPPMIEACRKIAALHPGLRVLNCALAAPYAGIRLYYSRIYECKFIAGAIAGAMADGDIIGYIANYPIYGVPAEINAFALGARMVKPRIKVKLCWSCLPGDPLQELKSSGISVISNRNAASPANKHHALEWGTYIHHDTSILPLAAPCWDWGRFYEQVIQGIFNGSYTLNQSDKAVNLWWGMRSGTVDIQLSDALPSGVRTLAGILRDGIIAGTIDPFLTGIRDQAGSVRCDGKNALAIEDIMKMDWLCDIVDGRIPDYSEIEEKSRETVRLLGLHHFAIAPEKEESQL